VRFPAGLGNLQRRFRQRLLLVVLRAGALAAFFAGRLAVVRRVDVDAVDARRVDVDAVDARRVDAVDARRVDEVDARRVDEVEAFFAGDLDVALGVDFVFSLPDSARFRWLS
jgi:hypothetical protein